MEARKKTMSALRRHVRESEQESLRVQMKLAGLQDDVRVAGAAADSDDTPTGSSATMKRSIPKDYDYDARALKPLARMLWALSISLGHAMTAHRQFTKLKSATISPDGLIGGRGYVMSVKDVRTALHDACEAISSVSDTIHDELHAPHWRPRLAELESADIESVERLVGDAERVLENPEDESFVEDGLSEAEAKGEQAELEEHEVADGDTADDGELDDEDDDGEFGSEIPNMSDSEASGQTKTASQPNSLFESISKRFVAANPEQTERPAEAFRGKIARRENALESRAAVVRVPANSSLPVQTVPGGPRVQHLDRGDVDQTGPFGSYTSNEPQSMHDDWSTCDGVGSRYDYQSEWDNDLHRRGLPKNAESRLPDNSIDDPPTQAWDFGIGYSNGNDAHGQGAGGYGPKDSDGKGVYGPSSRMPSDPGGKLHGDTSDSTPSIEMEMGRGNRHATYCAQSHLPNDGQPPVARSDYYRGDKGSNPMNVGSSAQTVATSELPAEAESFYEFALDAHPGIGYRYERNQPYVKWDHSTRNMRPDNLHQRNDDGPYVKQES